MVARLGESGTNHQDSPRIIRIRRAERGLPGSLVPVITVAADMQLGWHFR
jgi:hypothetical protein